MTVRSCYLRCVGDPTKLIHLPNGKNIKIGRNRETDIRDLNVSRSQLICTADFTEQNLIVKTVGQNPSGCNGYCLEKDSVYKFKNGDQIEVILGSHPYVLVFEDDKEEKARPTKRIKLDNEMQSSEDSKDKWEHIDHNELLIYTTAKCISRSFIASFDIDGTIIKTKSGAKFPKDMSDWVLNFPTIPQKLKELYENDHKIVFFTNQSSLSRDSGRLKEFKTKIEKIALKLTVPLQVYIATGKNLYRKPMTGMWNTLCTLKNDNVPIDLNKSFFVGDAAGREKNWAPKKNKDHSICDRLFALNVGIKFYTPEEYFLKASVAKFKMPEFDPRETIASNYPDFKSDEQEVILMVGVQGSGKSHFCREKLIPEGYVYINRDSLGAWQKCVKKLEECLQQGKSAVVDNTNPDKASRAKYIDVAKKCRVKCRCFLMDVSHNHAKHNNRFRELTDKSHMVVSDILLNSYKKNFQPPELSEGFESIVKIPCIPTFNNQEHEKLYKSFLLES